MSEKIKHILSIAGGWIIFFAIAGLLMIAPNVYFLATTASWSGRQALCAENGAEAKSVPLRDVALRPDELLFQQVAVSGKLLYVPERETFYLRDGVFSIPLDVSGCKDIEAMKQEETRVMARGGIEARDGGTYMNVARLREAPPGFLKIIFSGGNLAASIGVFVFVALGIARFLRWLFTAIGLKKPAVPPSPEEAGNKAAGRMLLASIGIPVLWLMNPIFGAGLHVFNVWHNRSGLQSPKRKVAIAGIVISVIGFVGMLVFAFGAGALDDPNKSINFYDMSAGQ